MAGADPVGSTSAAREHGVNGWIVGGLIAVVLVATGRYERVQRWSRDHAGKLYLGIWLVVTLVVLITGIASGSRPLIELVLVAAGGGLFSAFGVWLFLVGFDYVVNRREDDPPQDTTRGPFGA